jgi:hypothetical protein
VLPSVLGYQRSSWGGNPANPYDTTRAGSLRSSSGSGVSVSANLVMVSLGEETRASTRGPPNHNTVALILPHKAVLSFNGGAIGADIYCDRPFGGRGRFGRDGGNEHKSGSNTRGSHTACADTAVGTRRELPRPGGSHARPAL